MTLRANKVEWIAIAGLIGAGCGSGPAVPDSGVPEPCPTCQLTAIEPEMARLGETVTLESTFSGDVAIRFADGEVVPATVLGPHLIRVAAISARRSAAAPCRCAVAQPGA